MHRSGLLAIAFALFLVLPACRKDQVLGDPAPPLASDCVPTPDAPPGLGWNFLIPAHVIMGPRFNPNDGDEFVFMERPNGHPIHYRIYRYRISTNTLFLLREGDHFTNMTNPLDWGGNGWILLNLGSSSEDANIFKMKDDGDSLIQLTFSSWNFNPVWSPSCQSFGYRHTGGGLGRSVLVNTITNEQDTLFSAPLSTQVYWFEEDRIAYTQVQYGMDPISLCNVALDECQAIGTNPIASADVGPGGSVNTGIGSDVLLWASESGLYRTSLVTGESSKLLDGCSSRYFVSLDYAPQTNKLLALRIRRTPVAENTLQIENELVLMNPDGTGMEILDIPFPD